MMLVALRCVVLASLVFLCQEEDKPLTMEQIQFIQQYEGKWNTGDIYHHGILIRVPEQVISGIQISVEGMSYLDLKGKKTGEAYKIKSVDVDGKRIDFVREVKGNKRLYSLRVFDESNGWLALNQSAEDKLPERVEPVPGVFCYHVSRDDE